MPRPKSADPLVPLALRVPSAVADEIRSAAAAANVSVSDIVRQRWMTEAVKPLGKPAPRRRVKQLGAVSGAEPVLLRLLAGACNNLNQLARQVNTAAKGKPLSGLQLMAALADIRSELERIEKTATNAD